MIDKDKNYVWTKDGIQEDDGALLDYIEENGEFILHVDENQEVYLHKDVTPEEILNIIKLLADIVEGPITIYKHDMNTIGNC